MAAIRATASITAVLFIVAPAFAQAPMVQCQVGAWSAVVPDYACQAIRSAARELIPRDGVARNHGIDACAQSLAPVTGQPWQMEAADICTAVLAQNVAAGWR